MDEAAVVVQALAMEGAMPAETTTAMRQETGINASINNARRDWTDSSIKKAQARASIIVELIRAWCSAGTKHQEDLMSHNDV